METIKLVKIDFKTLYKLYRLRRNTIESEISTSDYESEDLDKVFDHEFEITDRTFTEFVKECGKGDIYE